MEETLVGKSENENEDLSNYLWSGMPAAHTRVSCVQQLPSTTGTGCSVPLPRGALPTAALAQQRLQGHRRVWQSPFQRVTDTEFPLTQGSSTTTIKH